MTLYLVLSIIIFIIGIVLSKKQYSPLIIKDYSSEKMQDRTFFRDLQDGFSFDVKNVEKTQIEHDTAVLKKVLKFAKTMPDEKRKLIKTLISNLKKRKVYFNNGITYEKAINIINLGTDDLYDLVYQNKRRILCKVFSVVDDNFNFEEEKEYAKKHGISEDELKNWFSEILSPYYITQGFINDEQYNLLYEDYLKNADLDNQKDIDNLAQKLETIFNEEQKTLIKNKNINIKDLAYSLIFWGENTIYRLSKLKKVLPENIFDDNNRNNLHKILTGYSTIDINTKDISETNTVQYNSKEFKTNFDIKNCVKNIFFIDAFNNQNYILNSLNLARRRYLKIPKVLVNFDLFSDIFTNRPPQKDIASWINNVIQDYRLTDVYWVIPDIYLHDQRIKEYFFEENTFQTFAFKGNYINNKVYHDFSKPLTQKFLFDVNSGILLSESVNFTNKELISYLKKGHYKFVTIHLCTPQNLPKLKHNFILSVDSTYFVNNGYDSFYFMEHIPINLNKYFDKFLKLWNEKLCKASFVFLSVSPKFTGISKVEDIRGFYEYLLNQVKLHSKKAY